ncbi:helix-turn-helix domain-containing protein [Rhizobium sp. CSW-27]|uniref:helix-turn-helix domain-containing protein n=1 Tax=Rhizobium sp. CSW-27 TaxID=2839985 RepID=UPI001C01B32A|nr:helix-turn-helix domain-containing protein [Rhizobium sp. CSW-27]MBT9370290.1 helix-turn-helix domain-containing protein [Rhizobium sp. CSW-27]
MSHDARFSIIPGWIITDPRLKPRSLQVLCLLGRHTDKHGWCRRSQVKMADQLGCARSTVQAAIDQLCDMGVVQKHIEESRDGRDSAHSYRVIYDAPPPSGYAFDAWAEEDSQEINPVSEAETATPPADISAPPAGPEPAPPAGPEPAPINDPYLTTPDKPEREGAGARSPEDRKKIIREFDLWLPTWPTYPNGSRDAALSRWMDLTPQQRADCIAKTPVFVAAVRQRKAGNFTYPAVYLRERAWERLDNPRDEIGPPTTHAPFSKPWMAALLAEVSRPMATKWPVMTAFQRLKASESAEAARLVEMERRTKYGWPKATAMLSDPKPISIPAHLVCASDAFGPVKPDSDLADRWKAMFERNGWPWSTAGVNMLQLPAGEPDEAMAQFQARINEVRGDDAA